MPAKTLFLVLLILASFSQRLSWAQSDASANWVSVDIPDGMMLRADSEQLFRVIANLVRNARQAIVARGQAGEIAVVAVEDASAWKIEVTDTGPGLPPKAQEHLFTPFQGGQSKGGSGLGLAISEELVRGHGGTLTLMHTGPQGTAFCISLPKGDVTL